MQRYTLQVQKYTFKVQVYFQITQVYFQRTKVYSGSTNLYCGKKPKTRLLRVLFDSIDLLALFGVYAGIIFLMETLHGESNMNN